MRIIPREQIEEENRKRNAFSSATDKVIEIVFEIRKMSGHEGFNGSALDVGALETCELKDQLVTALAVCQKKAVQLGLNFQQWQQFDLPIVIAEHAEEQKDPEEN